MRGDVVNKPLGHHLGARLESHVQIFRMCVRVHSRVLTNVSTPGLDLLPSHSGRVRSVPILEAFLFNQLL